MDIKLIQAELKKLYPDNLHEIITYCTYLDHIKNDRDKSGKFKNPWLNYKTDNQLITYFCNVAKTGLFIDGRHITLLFTGISFDYVAYKNKMFKIYPDSLFDIGLVYKDDTFEFQKNSGTVKYLHQLNNPFEQTENDIIGAYCVIKNKRGEFLTVMSRSDMDKHRLLAKTNEIWKNWLSDMYLKTIIKKSCKMHFEDIYIDINTIDNENYDLDAPLTISAETKSEIEKIKTQDDLKKYYKNNINKNKGTKEDFINALTAQKEILLSKNNEKDKEN